MLLLGNILHNRHGPAARGGVADADLLAGMQAAAVVSAGESGWHNNCFSYRRKEQSFMSFLRKHLFTGKKVRIAILALATFIALC